MGEIYTAETINDLDVEDEEVFESKVGGLSVKQTITANIKDFFLNSEDDKE